MSTPTSLNFLSFGLSRVAIKSLEPLPQLPERSSPLLPVEEPIVSQLDLLFSAPSLKDRALLALQPVLSHNRDLLIAGNYREQQNALSQIFQNLTPELRALFPADVLGKTQALLKEIEINQEILDAGRNALKSA